MSAPIHLVRAKIDEARARGELEMPRSDEARVLAEMDELLVQLARAEGKEALRVRAQLSVKQCVLASILERTGQSVLAGALWDPMASVAVYDFG